MPKPFTPLPGRAHPSLLQRHGLSLLLCLLPLAVPAAPPSTGSVIVFNTVCARCHEGECSGRLSFTDSRDASRGHILRHYPEAGAHPGMTRELFALLDHMKKECSFYPLQQPAGSGRSWGGDALEPYATPGKRNLFIPIGKLPPGTYRLHVETDREIRLRVQLVTENFDLVVETCENTSNGRLDLPFTIEEPEHYFLRLYLREPAKVGEVRIEALE